MEHLARELSVLSKAVHFKNLSGAAVHVGLSQPQLSRIILKLEAELKASLLDREARRKSAWTPLAHQLAEAYQKSSRSLSSEIQRIVGSAEPTLLTIGSLEGLIPLALSLSRNVLKNTAIRTVEMDVHDLNRLEELFFNGSLDLILTSREPGRKKFKYLKVLGYQSLDPVDKPGEFGVMSSFEFESRSSRGKSRTDETPVFISNSLAARKGWLEKYGGRGCIPSEVRKNKSTAADCQEVYLIGTDTLGDALWKKVTSGM